MGSDSAGIPSHFKTSGRRKIVFPSGVLWILSAPDRTARHTVVRSLLIALAKVEQSEA